MKIIDCFLYFDEDMLLDLRLNILDKYVDKFIIVEADLDHAGNKRQPQFNISNFKKFKNKINYFLIKDLPSHNNFYKKNWGPSWRRENYQRNALELGYKDCDQNDLIMISDLDEIPNPTKICDFGDKYKYGCFVQKNFCMKFNLLNDTQPNWFGTRICKKKYLKSPQWLREIKIKRRPFYKFFKPKFDKFIFEGGWHFSSIKSAEGIAKKINSFAHNEQNIEKFTNINLINTRLKNHTDLFDRNFKFKPIKIDENFPKYLVDNVQNFKEFIC